MSIELTTTLPDIVIRIPESLWPEDAVTVRAHSRLKVTVGAAVQQPDYNSSDRHLIVPLAALAKPFFTSHVDDPLWQSMLAAQHVKFWRDNRRQELEDALVELECALRSAAASLVDTA